MSVAQTLKQRKKTHGDFSKTAEVIQDIKAVMHESPNWSSLSATQKETLEMNAHKIGRILCGDPSVADHWHDIAGYSVLQEKLCEAAD